MNIDITKYCNTTSFAQIIKKRTGKNISRQRIMQLIADGRINSIVMDGWHFILKTEKIKPSKKKRGWEKGRKRK